MNAETLITWEMTGGFLGVTILMPIFNYYFPADYWFPKLEDWMWLFVLAIFCTVWAFQLSSNALKKLSAFTVNLSYNLEPVYGILLAFAVYKENEQLDISFYIGIAIIAFAVLLQTWRVWRSRQLNSGTRNKER
jgi:drug/metabolite transporter (DMT)-like permease